MRGWARAVFVGVLALPAVACGSMNYLVEGFSERHICPQDQMTVRNRPDIRLSTWICAHPGAIAETIGDKTQAPRETVLAAFRNECGRQPPADVAGDPARRAEWERDREEWRKQLEEEGYDTPVEVSGCGFRTIVACAHGRGAYRGCYMRLVMVPEV